MPSCTCEICTASPEVKEHFNRGDILDDIINQCPECHKIYEKIEDAIKCHGVNFPVDESYKYLACVYKCGSCGTYFPAGKEGLDQALNCFKSHEGNKDG